MNAYDIQFNKLSDRVNSELYHNGYSILGRIDKEQLRSLKADTKGIVGEIEQWDSKGRLFALVDTYRDLFLRSHAIVDKYMGPFLREHFDLDQVEVNAASHFIKPWGKKGKFLCHQDSAVVQEPEEYAVNAWMPLTDVNRINGCIWALPGSHILPHYLRYAGFNPYADPQVQKELWSRLTPVPMKAGEVLLFHRSLLHGSSVNYLPYNRIAVESLITRKGVQLVIYYRDAEVPDGRILMFPVDRNHFFDNEDPRGKLLRERKNVVELPFPDKGYASSLLPQYYKAFQERAKPRS